jgi:hypothetical protein
MPWLSLVIFHCIIAFDIRHRVAERRRAHALVISVASLKKLSVADQSYSTISLLYHFISYVTRLIPRKHPLSSVADDSVTPMRKNAHSSQQSQTQIKVLNVIET